MKRKPGLGQTDESRSVYAKFTLHRRLGIWCVDASLFVLILFVAGCSMPQGSVPMVRTPGALRGGITGGRGDLAPGNLGTPEELWVISRSISNSGPVAQSDEPLPGTGMMILENEDSGKIVPLPLQHTDVKARVTAYISSVEVRQQFHNPFSGKIEAKYVFPLPQDAAVTDFLMIIGERRIRGIIREREDAEEIYLQAKASGLVASLLTQERPNIFTQSIANIDPGKSIDVSVTYFNTLAYRDGWYEFVFPMVVGPRFNPPGSTDGVGAAPRGGFGRSGQNTEVTYLAPKERSGSDIALSLDIDAGVAIEEFKCPSHVIESNQSAPEKLHVELGRLDRIPNKDFVLRYRVAGDRLKSNLLTHHDARGGFFTLMVYPPADLQKQDRHPLEMVFVIDCSGSMSGEPIAQAKAAVRRAITQMRPDDTFQIIRFSNRSSQLGKDPLPATRANVSRGLAYLNSLEGGGGTMMIEGIKAALDFPHDPSRLRFVVFLTDGYIGNESEIFAAVNQRLGQSRIFSFGVGTAVNGYLLDGLARIGKGAVAYLGPHDDAATIMDNFVKRIGHPALLDVAFDWGGLNVPDVYPSRLPDVFVGRPLIVTGRYDGAKPALIKVSGTAGGRHIVTELRLNSDDAEPHPALASIWARKKIMALADQQNWNADPTLATQIKQVALDFNLMSAYTAFIAVDSLSRTGGDFGTTVHQAVPVPEGARYDTTAWIGE